MPSLTQNALSSASVAPPERPSLASRRAKRRILFQAVYEGDASKVARLIKRGGYEVNHQDPVNLRAPLYWAVSRKSADVAKVLLDAGADPNLVFINGRTALRIALEQRDSECFELLLPVSNLSHRCAMGLSCQEMAARDTTEWGEQAERLLAQEPGRREALREASALGEEVARASAKRCEAGSSSALAAPARARKLRV